jgi:uncharacterized protein YndB with AHSA1/START domain
MARTVITPDLDTIVSEIDIAAPIDRVFAAIADAEVVRRRTPQLSAYEMELRVGGRWFLEMPHQYKGFSLIRHEGEVLEYDPPRVLAFTWLANFHKDPRKPSIVRWELTKTGSGTHVKVTHSGLASEPDSAKEYAGGWPGVLEDLKKFAEQ